MAYQKKSGLREAAEKHADFGDHDYDAQAGAPKASLKGQGAAGTYKPLEPQIGKGPGKLANEKAPYKTKGGK